MDKRTFYGLGIVLGVICLYFLFYNSSGEYNSRNCQPGVEFKETKRTSYINWYDIYCFRSGSMSFT